MWWDYPFIQQNKETKKAVEVEDGGKARGWTKFEKGGGGWGWGGSQNRGSVYKIGI